MTAPKKLTRGTAAYFGPREASYSVTIRDSRVSGYMLGGPHVEAHREAHAYAEDRARDRALEGSDATITVERSEHCPEPGCHHGSISRRRRGSAFYADAPCPTCSRADAPAPCWDTIEATYTTHAGITKPPRQRRRGG